MHKRMRIRSAKRIRVRVHAGRVRLRFTVQHSVDSRAGMAASVRPRNSSSGYEKLRASHKRAYTYLSQALQIDERGVGEQTRLLVAGCTVVYRPQRVTCCVQCIYMERHERAMVMMVEST